MYNTKLKLSEENNAELGKSECVFSLTIFHSLDS